MQIKKSIKIKSPSPLHIIIVVLVFFFKKRSIVLYDEFNLVKRLIIFTIKYNDFDYDVSFNFYEEFNFGQQVNMTVFL